MIYGLYLSATGILTNSYRQDVIANNLANAETVGFKKDLAMFQERRTALREGGFSPSDSNALLEKLGGGTFAAPSRVDTSQGDIEVTGQPLDAAIAGDGFFAVNDRGKVGLTRAGHFTVNQAGRLALANSDGQEVLSPQGKPITLDPRLRASIDSTGTVRQEGNAVGRIGLFDVADRSLLRKQGATLLSHPDAADAKNLLPATGQIQCEAVERGNVEPANELAQLMDAQRQLEANANMIHYQDQTLSKLVNDVGKIG